MIAFLQDVWESSKGLLGVIAFWFAASALMWAGDEIKARRKNVQVDLPDTAAQDSASKSNSPAVSG